MEAIAALEQVRKRLQTFQIDAHSTQSQNDHKTDLLLSRHDKRSKHEERQHDQGDILYYVDRCVGIVESRCVDAFARDARVPEFRNWHALEDAGDEGLDADGDCEPDGDPAEQTNGLLGGNPKVLEQN